MRCPAATIPGAPARQSPRHRTARTAISAWAAALSLAAPAAIAGPWARGEGDVFLSFGLTTEDTRTALILGPLDPERTYSVYGEFGLSERFTAGLDLDWGEVSRMGVIFLRRTLTHPDAALQVAVDAGAGTRTVEGQPSQTLTRLGGSVGWGFGAWDGRVGQAEFSHEGGWISLDATALFDTEGLDPILQSELTFGLNLSPRTSGILAFTAEEWPGAEPVVTARPSITFALTNRTRVQAGAHAALDGSEVVGLSLSLWQDF